MPEILAAILLVGWVIAILQTESDLHSRGRWPKLTIRARGPQPIGRHVEVRLDGQVITNVVRRLQINIDRDDAHRVTMEFYANVEIEDLPVVVNRHVSELVVLDE